MRRLGFAAFGLAVAALAVSGPASAAGLKIVVFDVEPVGMAHSPDIDAKLKAQTDLLRKLMSDKGYTVVDTAPQAKKIADNLPLSECNGCDSDIAKALGADLEVATGMQEVSPSLFTLSGAVTDVKSGRVLRRGIVNVQSQDPGAWAHGVKYLVRERLMSPPLPDDAAALNAAGQVPGQGGH